MPEPDVTRRRDGRDWMIVDCQRVLGDTAQFRGWVGQMLSEDCLIKLALGRVEPVYRCSSHGQFGSDRK